jgi:hypothetical protein
VFESLIDSDSGPAKRRYAVDAGGSGNDQAVTQNRGRVTVPAVLRDDAVADVTALSGEELVELVSDRRAANELTGDLGNQGHSTTPPN